MLKNWRAEALKHLVALSLCSSTVLLLVISLTCWCGPDVYTLYSVVINKTRPGFLCYSIMRSVCEQVEKLSAMEQTPKTAERNVLKELFPSEVLDTPTGIR